MEVYVIKEKNKEKVTNINEIGDRKLHLGGGNWINEKVLEDGVECYFGYLGLIVKAQYKTDKIYELSIERWKAQKRVSKYLQVEDINSSKLYKKYKGVPCVIAQYSNNSYKALTLKEWEKFNFKWNLYSRRELGDSIVYFRSCIKNIQCEGNFNSDTKEFKGILKYDSKLSLPYGEFMDLFLGVIKLFQEYENLQTKTKNDLYWKGREESKLKKEKRKNRVIKLKDLKKKIFKNKVSDLFMRSLVRSARLSCRLTCGCECGDEVSPYRYSDIECLMRYLSSMNFPEYWSCWNERTLSHDEIWVKYNYIEDRLKDWKSKKENIKFRVKDVLLEFLFNKYIKLKKFRGWREKIIQYMKDEKGNIARILDPRVEKDREFKRRNSERKWFYINYDLIYSEEKVEK